MLATQIAPTADTDREFFRGVGKLEDQFGGEGHTNDMDKVIATAVRHGYRPNPNDVYTPSLARFRGDPLAFVPPTGAKSHIKKVCEQHGWECDGSVKVKAREPESDPWDDRKPLANDIVQQHIQSRVSANPELARADQNELKQEVIDRHALK
jgi:hypothetical protein